MSDKKHTDYEIEKLVDIDYFSTVTKTIGTRGKKNAHILDLLKIDWPASQTIIEKLSLLITAGIKKNKEPIIYLIIEEALQRYSDVVFHNNSKKYDDPIRIGVFLETIITATCRVLEIQIMDSQGNKWSVDSCQSFFHWTLNHPGELAIYQYQHQDEHSLRSLLYDLMTCNSVKNVLKRANYEEAVLAGRMAFSY